MRLTTDQNLNGHKEKLLSAKIASRYGIELYLMNTKRLTMFLKTAVLVLCLSPYTLTFAKAAMGAGSGGGGGAYRTKEGKLVTLPEFGVLIEDKGNSIETTGKEYDVYYKISDRTKEELKAIKRTLSTRIKGASLPEGYKDEVVSSKGTFLYKKNVDPALYAKIKDEYRAVLRAFNYQLEEDKFVLPAVTVGKKTYIFPEFDQLTPMQQAKYLIHEAGMRNGISDSPEKRIKLLEYVLKVDTVIEKVMSTKEKKDLDVMAVMKSLVKLKMLDLNGVVSNIIQMMSEELGREVKENEIFVRKDVIEVNRSGWSSLLENEYFVTLDPIVIQETQIANNLKRNYAEMLEGTVLNLWTPYASGSYQDCDEQSNFFTPSYLLHISRCFAGINGEYRQTFSVLIHEAGPFLRKFEE